MKLTINTEIMIMVVVTVEEYSVCVLRKTIFQPTH